MSITTLFDQDVTTAYDATYGFINYGLSPSIIDQSTLQVGDTYDVVFNGTTYQCEIKSSEIFYLGNLYMYTEQIATANNITVEECIDSLSQTYPVWPELCVDTGEPFLIGISASETTFVTEQEGTYHFTINKEVYKSMALSQVTATINGQQYVLTLNESTGKYEATVAAPSKSSFSQDGHYYDVSISAVDDAGNTSTVNSSDGTIGDQCKLVVKETVAPVITITAPTASQVTSSNAPKLVFTVTDNDSGVNPDKITVYVDSKAYTANITKTTITGGYSCEFSIPTLSDGTHKVYVTAEDNDGNLGTAAEVSFTVDTTPPELSVTSPADGTVINKNTVTVIGTTNDATSNSVKLTINGEEVNVGSDGSFTHIVTLRAGSNTITIVATDEAGKSSTITRTVNVNTSAPVISAIAITPNPVNAGNTFTISVTVTDE